MLWGKWKQWSVPFNRVVNVHILYSSPFYMDNHTGSYRMLINKFLDKGGRRQLGKRTEGLTFSHLVRLNPIKNNNKLIFIRHGINNNVVGQLFTFVIYSSEMLQIYLFVPPYYHPGLHNVTNNHKHDPVGYRKSTRKMGHVVWYNMLQCKSSRQ